MIEHPESERAGLFTGIELDLLAKGAVAIPQKNRKRITADVGRQQIGQPVLIHIGRGDSRRALTNLITGKIVEEIRWGIRILFGTAACHKKAQAGRQGHKTPWPTAITAVALDDHARLLEQRT